MDKFEEEASPYEPPVHVEPAKPASNDSGGMSGINLHWLDNLLQAACIVACAILGGIISGTFREIPGASSRNPGVVLGAFLGMLFGLLSSGIFIMIYRSGRRSRRSTK